MVLMVFAAILAAFCVYAYTAEPSLSTLQVVVDKFRSLGGLGVACAATLYAVLAMLPMPLSPLTALGGYLMGFWLGLATLWPAAILAAVISHWLGARFLGRRLDWFRTRFPKAKVVLDSAASTGWRSVIVNRLLPVCPFAIQNMLLGAIGIRKRDQALGTALGILPASLFALYCGSVAEELTLVLTSPHTVMPQGRMMLLGLSVVACLLVLLWIRGVIKKSFSSQ